MMQFGVSWQPQASEIPRSGTPTLQSTPPTAACFPTLDVLPTGSCSWWVGSAAPGAPAAPEGRRRRPPATLCPEPRRDTEVCFVEVEGACFMLDEASRNQAKFHLDPAGLNFIGRIDPVRVDHIALAGLHQEGDAGREADLSVHVVRRRDTDALK